MMVKLTTGHSNSRNFRVSLIQNVANVKLGQTIVVTHGGGSFDVQPWINRIGALLHASYPGQNGEQALGEILFRTVNPSGKLPFTWEKLITDNPAVATFPMPLNQKPPNPTKIRYSEGIFVGYRGYEEKHIQPQFSFGFGLSYTTFAYSDLDIEPAGDRDDHKELGLPKAEFRKHGGQNDDLVNVSFTVTNIGDRAGAEVAELYVGQQNPTVPRPIKELKPNVQNIDGRTEDTDRVRAKANVLNTLGKHLDVTYPVGCGVTTARRS
jgi:beta-glucosidase